MRLAVPQLKNEHIRLELFKPSGEWREFLKKAGVEEAMWSWLPRIRTGGVSYEAYYAHVTERIESGQMISYMAYEGDTDKFVGIISYLRPRRVHRRVEIGLAWTLPQKRRSLIALSMHSLMIDHALKWGARRIYWHTDTRNTAYIAFLEDKIKSEKEGVMESFTRMYDGSWSDVAVFALIDQSLKKAAKQIRRTLERE